jgi:hypothetical protein
MTAPAPPIHPDVLARVRKAAHAATTAYPGPMGDLARRELIGWCDVGSRFGGLAWVLALAADIEAKCHALTLGLEHR